MKTLAAAVTLAALLGSAPIASALPSPACCACVANGIGPAQTSGTNNTAQTVFFCAVISAGDSPAEEQRCDSVSNGTALLECVASVDPTAEPCREQLAGIGVICPAAGAPAVAPLNLLTLAVVLGALGSVLLARRVRHR